MSGPDDIDALAGEYVLGTLDAAERAEVAARRLREPALDAAILAWENRLAPLNADTPEVAPSPAIWSRILARIEAGRAGVQDIQDTIVTDLTQRLKRWRAAAILAGAIAATFAIAFVWRGPIAMSPAENFVAVLQDDKTPVPYFIVEIDQRSHMMTVHPIGAGRQPGKSYELWLIHDGFGEPKSLGVVADQGFTVKPTLAKYDTAAVDGGQFAITLEPAGGAPNGKPSGPPLWIGKMFQATP
jgi:anti-sigma-K factor RskA